MSVTVDSFLASYPEFRSAERDLLQAKLDAAEPQVDSEVWGDKTDQGVELTAAHLLAISPFGQNARLVAKDGSTTYSKRLREMQLQVTGGYRLI